MKNILEEISRLKVLRMRETLVQDFNHDRWMVFDHPKGKFIVDSTFQVGAVLPWASLETLQEMSKRKSFEWTTDDGLISVKGKQGCWNLEFRMNEPPYCLINDFLSAAETKTIKQNLFTQYKVRSKN